MTSPCRRETPPGVRGGTKGHPKRNRLLESEVEAYEISFSPLRARNPTRSATESASGRSIWQHYDGARQTNSPGDDINDKLWGIHTANFTVAIFLLFPLPCPHRGEARAALTPRCADLEYYFILRLGKRRFVGETHAGGSGRRRRAFCGEDSASQLVLKHTRDLSTAWHDISTSCLDYWSD